MSPGERKDGASGKDGRVLNLSLLWVVPIVPPRTLATRMQIARGRSMLIAKKIIFNFVSPELAVFPAVLAVLLE